MNEIRDIVRSNSAQIRRDAKNDKCIASLRVIMDEKGNKYQLEACVHQRAVQSLRSVEKRERASWMKRECL